MKKDLKALWILLTCALLIGGCGSAELEEANAKLTDENKTLQKEKKDLEKEVETLKAEAETTQTQITTLQTSLDDMTKKVTAQADEVNFYIDTNAVLEQEKTELQEKLNAANETIGQMQASAAAAPAPQPTFTPAPPIAATTPVPPTQTLPTNTVPAAPPPPSFPPTDPAVAAATSVASGFAPAPSTAAPPTTTVPAPAPAVTEISPDNPLVNPTAGQQANLTIALYIVAGGRNIPLPNTEIYITEKQPNVSKWGFHLKDPNISANQLAQIQQSLATSIIHKRVTTDATGNAVIPTIKAGVYWVSCGNPASKNGLQWSVQHILNPGANQLALSNGNILQ